MRKNYRRYSQLRKAVEVRRNTSEFGGIPPLAENSCHIHPSSLHRTPTATDGRIY